MTAPQQGGGGMERVPGPGGSSWTSDGLSAALLDEQGGWEAGLEIARWYEDQSREPVAAWVVSWPVPGGGGPHMYEAAIQQPALFADDNHSRAELVRLARRAMGAPRTSVPEPFELPAKPADADDWDDLIRRQIFCWADSFSELREALEADQGTGSSSRYRRAVEALGWAYTVDSSLQVLWGSLGAQSKEEESLQTDAQAAASAANNTFVLARFGEQYDVQSDQSFAAYHRRQQDRQPYKRWSDLMMAGMFQSRFFGALSWVRGHMVHAAADLPMELQQYKPGTEPRWKFSHSSTFRRGDHQKNARELYDQVLAGHDVVGGFSFLTEVFSSAGIRLVARLHADEAAGKKR